MSEELFGGVVPSGSPDFRSELAVKLAELVPEVIADGKVDVAKLQELLGSNASDDKLERFGLFWPGKRRALQAAQELTTATLLPDLENSRDWDTTGNVFIEGDNLEVLKILQRHYHGKIKMIYIDPPYNTGKDFVYPDNYKEGLASYLEWTKQVNEEGKKISTNSDTDGRYHSNWLSMMYPRLKLAKNLLTEDGVIFISIDDNEYENLKKICNEIFGENSYVGTISWLKKRKGSFLSKGIISMHEYALVYGRKQGAKLFGGIADVSESQPLVKRTNSRGKLIFPKEAVSTTMQDGTLEPGLYGLGSSAVKLVDTANISDGKFDSDLTLEGPFIWTQEFLNHQIGLGARITINTLNLQPRVFKINEEDQFKGLSSIFDGVENRATNEDAYEHSIKLFGVEGVLEYPKPVNYLKALLLAATNFSKDAVVLDFFAGSGTLAEAVMEANRDDGGKRKFVLVQLPEPTDKTSAAFEAGYKSISQICLKRLSIISERFETEFAPNSIGVAGQDFGFRAFRLAESNFPFWRVSNGASVSELEKHINEIAYFKADEARAFDCLVEVLIKLGFSLNVPLKLIDSEVFAAYSVGDGDFIAVVGSKKTAELDDFATLLELKPSRVLVMEDTYQGSDELKTNLEQECSNRQIELIKK